jgi:tagatose-6-phosphate ketose/aldose isomerase
MDALSKLLALSDSEKQERGLRYTPSEIAQQPATWRGTFDRFHKQHQQTREFLATAKVAADGGSSRPVVFLVGAGTSDYIGQSVAFLLRAKWQCEVLAVPSTDLVTHQDELLLPGKKYLWVSFSRSGDSPEGVAALHHALEKRPDIRHVIISCNANGRMVKDTVGLENVYSICLDDAVNDRGLAMTSSFSNMVIAGQCLAHVYDWASYEDTFPQIAQAGETLLPVAADCAASLASMGLTKACMVGSGPLRGVARESALKVLELTAGRTLTMSESALGLRHGPMAALDEKTLFVCFLSGDPRVQKFEVDLLKEIGQKHLVRHRVIVSAREHNGISLAEHHLSPLIDFVVPDVYRPPIDVIFGQLLGLFFSLESNLLPDTPSPTGAISRVVHNVTIHA